MGLYDGKSIILYLEPIVFTYLDENYAQKIIETYSDINSDIIDDLLDFTSVIILHEIGHAWDKMKKGFLKETKPTEEFVINILNDYIKTVPNEELESEKINDKLKLIVDELYQDYKNEELDANKNGKFLIRECLFSDDKLLDYFEKFDEHIKCVVEEDKKKILDYFKKTMYRTKLSDKEMDG